MNEFLPYLLLVTLAGYTLNHLLPSRREGPVVFTALGTVLVNAALFLVFGAQWLAAGCPDLPIGGPVLYASGDAHFSLDFFFDRYTAVYFLVASVLTVLVMLFSRYYVHRERGFKRFFNNVLFFYLGIETIVFSGNFETLFVGWEIIGITSFTLIAFYRDRYLPVKNALKVLSLYRLADISLLLGIWICHHYFQRSVTFGELKQLAAAGAPLIEPGFFAMAIPMTFLVAAMVKSAQAPFSSWLPRAMEGPTTSSAIFYGSLSVHIGVFLLLRTWPLWGDHLAFRLVVIGVGLATGIVATLIARVQSSVKTQIAYSSIAQIGLMFIEVALGWHTVALLHFAGNAFLRSYQLLVSPSVLSYLIHDQFFHFIAPPHDLPRTLRGRFLATVYVLSIREWNLDRAMYRYLWQPLKRAGHAVRFLTPRSVAAVFAPLFAAGLYLAYHRAAIPTAALSVLPGVLSVLSLALILRAFTERAAAERGWLFIVASQFFTALAIACNEQFDIAQVYLYLSGICGSALVGYGCMYWLRRGGESTLLDRFRGHSYEHPRLAALFLVACLGLAGFPVTPTFIGEDVILGHVHENQLLLTLLIALSLILDGLAVFRIYARLFMGPHEEGWHEVAYRSS